MGTYTQFTEGIRIAVTPQYLAGQSDPDENRFVWAYHVAITNEGSETVQLVNRFWRITDATGHSHEVRGEGVVGEQPVLAPGESFEYTSGTPLATPSGFMVGSYEMRTDAGRWFEAGVPAFALDRPDAVTHLH